MRAIGIEPENIFLEPAGRNTAPAAAVAALAIAAKDPDAVLFLMPADHMIHDLPAFLKAVETAHDLAKHGHLVTFGIQPRGPDTGYGYIQRGAALRADGTAFAVSRFVEKPDSTTARRYIEAGDYYWNSGMFAFRARAFLSELERLQPDIVASCREALSTGISDSDYFRLDPKAFEACRSISIDYAVMEHTDKAAIVPVEMGWSDIGSWAALWDASAKDADGNAIMGDVLHHDTHNSYLRSEGPLIAALGAQDLVVVATNDAVLVAPKSTAQDVKKIVERLEGHGSGLHIAHRMVHYPWGSAECISQGKNFRVNRITVNPGAVLSLPAQSGRSGQWVVVSGSAQVTRGDKIFQLNENQNSSVSDSSQLLENITDVPLSIIEVQTGGHLDDARQTTLKY